MPPQVNCFRVIERTAGIVLMVMLGLGCHRNSSGPPVPLPIEQLPSALEKAFSKARTDPKELARQVIASLETRDYPKAYVGLQHLAALPDLSKEQIDVTTRGALTVNGLLQSAQAKGDAEAAKTLQFIRENK